METFKHKEKYREKYSEPPRYLSPLYISNLVFVLFYFIHPLDYAPIGIWKSSLLSVMVRPQTWNLLFLSEALIALSKEWYQIKLGHKGYWMFLIMIFLSFPFMCLIIMVASSPEQSHSHLGHVEGAPLKYRTKQLYISFLF